MYSPGFEHRRVARAARNKAVVFAETATNVVGNTYITAHGVVARDKNVQERLLKGHAGAALAGL